MRFTVEAHRLEPFHGPRYTEAELREHVLMGPMETRFRTLAEGDMCVADFLNPKVDVWWDNKGRRRYLSYVSSPRCAP